ncbi:1-phosphofructokinase family hexose kinase [uncultured Methylophaga sp.]|uniref:1-phosphofructokinase family hexose kinase n=1 Tax=uncultured Methylophaga sp. TaxID=285271 RepID=UPI00261F3F85|nr:1-phosphofructokinase family hexose kinase [uncultured Methylophaga sp.]
MTPSSVKIHVLCLNPALDVTYHVKKLIPDQKSRSDAARHDPGGNGINIGRALFRMGVDATTYCVIAGAVGEILQDMLVEQLPNVMFNRVSGQTRINSTIIELDTKSQFQITDAGTPVPADQLTQLVENFADAVGNGYGILTGSCQPTIPASLYADLVNKIQQQGGRAVVDSHGEILRLAIEAKPFLIKPNLYELETLLQVKLDTKEAIAECARQLQLSGVTHVCVSLGDKGALLVSPNNSVYAKALSVPVNTTVGAGDSMVAGLVAGFSLDNQPKTALRYGIACGAGTVMHAGTELFQGDELADFRQQVTIQTLDI